MVFKSKESTPPCVDQFGPCQWKISQHFQGVLPYQDLPTNTGLHLSFTRLHTCLHCKHNILMSLTSYLCLCLSSMNLLFPYLQECKIKGLANLDKLHSQCLDHVFSRKMQPKESKVLTISQICSPMLGNMSSLIQDALCHPYAFLNPD